MSMPSRQIKRLFIDRNMCEMFTIGLMYAC